VYFTSLSKFVFETGLNIIDTTRRQKSYEYRMDKYLDRGFALMLPKGTLPRDKMMEKWKRVYFKTMSMDRSNEKDEDIIRGSFYPKFENVTSMYGGRNNSPYRFGESDKMCLTRLLDCMERKTPGNVCKRWKAGESIISHKFGFDSLSDALKKCLSPDRMNMTQLTRIFGAENAKTLAMQSLGSALINVAKLAKDIIATIPDELRSPPFKFTEVEPDINLFFTKAFLADAMTLADWATVVEK
jgi:flagellar biosynthesis/type III secretory pathway chaperone